VTSAGASAGGSANSAGSAGADSGAGGQTAAPIAAADLCPIFTADLCVYLMQCDGVRYRDAAECQAELDCYGLPQLLDANAKGTIDYDPAEVGACHQRFIQSPCTFGFFLGTPDIYDVLAFCPGAVTAKQTANGACSSDGECVSGLYCNKGADFTCPGTCQPFATEGQTCTGSVRCADGLTCSDQTCQKQPKPGDPCTGFCSYSVSCPSDQVCPENLWCDPTQGQCELAHMAGEPCGEMGSGAGAYVVSCAINLWCNGPTLGAGTCQAPGGEGAPCNQDPAACTSGLHCVGYDDPSSPTLGTCSGASAAGTNCLAATDCQSGLACVTGKCGTPLAAGATCNQDNDCAAGLVCPAGKCISALYPGDSCSAAAPCAYSRCVAGKCADYVKVGDACTMDGDCATNHCVANKCYDSSICNAPPAAP
jgi:hypothetical protein